jgi:hypothetical protein
MLVMADGRLQVQIVATGAIVPATWPAGFAARWGNQITILDDDGHVVMTQGVEEPTVRARITSEGAEICGFGDVIYP